MIVLHGMGSPNVIKVMIMLEECGLHYETRHVAVFNQGQFAPEFLALNPFGKVPVIEDPKLGRPLFESGAILIWLAEREGRFLPTAQPDRAEVIEWLMVQMANVGPMFGQLNHFRSVLGTGTNPYAEARYSAQAEKLYRLLDDRLQSREWIAGGDYSIADMAMAPWAGYIGRHGFDSASFPHLMRWLAAVDARPAVQRARVRSQADFADVSEQTRKAATPADLDAFFGRTASVPPADFSAVVQR